MGAFKPIVRDIDAHVDFKRNFNNGIVDVSTKLVFANEKNAKKINNLLYGP